MERIKVVIANEPVSCAEIMKRFPQFFVDSSGDLSRSVRGVAGPETASRDTILFMANPKALKQGLDRPASVWVVSPKNRALVESHLSERTLLIANNVERAMASVANEFFLKTPYTNYSVIGVHLSANVSPSARLAKDVRVGPGAFIGAGVQLDAGVYIGANAVIEDETHIGENSVVHPLVFIGHSTEIGKNCEILPNSVVGKEGFGYANDEKFNHYRIPHQGRVVLEDDVHLGSCVTIDRGTYGETRIECGAKLDNQVHIGHNARIGKNAYLVAGFLIAGSSKVGANFVAGGKSVVTGHIEVCDNVQLAALSAVGKSITKPGQYGGLPLLPVQQYIKAKAALVHLPEMRKQMKAIIKKLGMKDESADED